MGKKSERIAELEKEAAAHNMQCNFLHEGNAALQKTIADLRREVVLRTQETRDLQNSKYLLWKENVELTAQLSDALRRNIERSIGGRGGLNECGTPLYPSMVEVEREKAECCIPDEALGRAFIAHREYLKKTDCSLSMYRLKERYIGLIGKPEHVKLEYFTVKHASERFRFRKHIHREWWILDGLQP